MQEITEITTKLKALAKELNVPILALTADYSDQTRRDCLANGMQDFLSKPVDATALWNSIRKQLGLA